MTRTNDHCARPSNVESRRPAPLNNQLRTGLILFHKLLAEWSANSTRTRKLRQPRCGRGTSPRPCNSGISSAPGVPARPMSGYISAREEGGPPDSSGMLRAMRELLLTGLSRTKGANRSMHPRHRAQETFERMSRTCLPLAKPRTAHSALGF